jgi:FixJ family two-component response regulator
MKLNALVMSRNAGAVKILVAAFAELGIEYRISGSASETIEMLATSRHSGVVIDFDLPHAVQVARVARELKGKAKPILFGMIGAGTAIAEVFEAGGNFALYKPLDLLQVLHSLRAAQAFMQQDRRDSSRKRGETLAYLQLPGGTIPALVQDLTQNGLAVQAAEPLVPVRGLSLRFLLPGTMQVVHAIGDFVWTDKSGRAGLYFTSIPAACRRDLEAWLRKRDAKKLQLAPAAMPHSSRAMAAAH